MEKIVYFVRLDENGYNTQLNDFYDTVSISYLEELFNIIQKDISIRLKERNELDESSNNNQHTCD